jgi:hypothetical protein
MRFLQGGQDVGDEERGEDADDGDDDQQFNQGKTLIFNQHRAVLSE